MNREAVFAAIDLFRDDFAFGVQTNGTLLTEGAADFLMQRNVSIGLSLDGPTAPITNATRHTWAGQGVHQHVLKAMERLKGYGSWSVITTCTTENLAHLTDMVELFHRHEVPTCMLNAVRCTLSGARGVKPADGDFPAMVKERRGAAPQDAMVVVWRSPPPLMAAAKMPRPQPVTVIWLPWPDAVSTTATKALVSCSRSACSDC